MVGPLNIDHVDTKRSKDALITNAWPLLVPSPGVHQDRHLQVAELAMPVEAREVVPEHSVECNAVFEGQQRSCGQARISDLEPKGSWKWPPAQAQESASGVSPSISGAPYAQ
jgi:hypothetical protein